jgi:excisionase family DNA binding protein
MSNVTTRLEHLRTLSAQLESEHPEQAERELEALFPPADYGRWLEILVAGVTAEAAGAQFLTVNQVAESVALHPKVVRRAIDAGELRAFKLRSRIRVRESDFAAWIEASRVEPYPIPELEP